MWEGNQNLKNEKPMENRCFGNFGSFGFRFFGRFWTSTFFVYVRCELSAENKRKRDTRLREFEEREAIAKLDPLHWQKYIRRMISEGFQPEEPELESITPTYDML